MIPSGIIYLLHNIISFKILKICQDPKNSTTLYTGQLEWHAMRSYYLETHSKED